MKKLKLVLSVMLMAFLINTGFSQTADEVIDNYAKAIGGADKLIAVNSAIYTGKLNGMGQEFPIVMTVKREGMARIDINFQGKEMIRAFDGKSGWVVNPFSPNKDAEKMLPEETKSMKQMSSIEGELINYKKKGSKVELMGKEDYEGSEVYKIKLTDKDGDLTYYFIDGTSYLILKETNKRKIGEKEINSETVYGNYKKTDDLTFPMSIEIKETGSDEGQKINIEKIELNATVADSVFEMPVVTK